MRIFSRLDSGSRSIHISIGLEYLPHVIADIERLAEINHMKIEPTTTLYAFLQSIKPFGNIGFGGDTQSIFPRQHES